MAASSGSKAGFWFFLILSLLVAYLMLVKEPWLVKSMEEERQSNYSLLGYDNAKLAEVRAHNLFTQWFVNSGITTGSFDLLVPKQAAADQLEHKADPAFEWIEGRVRSIWLVVYQVMTRISTALIWWPFAVLTLIPFVIDAFVRRAIKAHTFDHASPHLQSIGMRAFIVALFGYPLLLFAPFAIPAALLPLLLFAVSGALWFAISHFVKRA